jgi:cardiolipin synthase
VADLQAVFLIDWYRATGDTGPLEAAGSFPPLAPRGPSTAQVVSGSPLPDGSDLAETIFTCLVIAKRRLVLVTPYFVPDEPTFEAILNASRRGVDVTLIVPRDGKHWYVTRATRSLFERLLRAGVRIWTRRPPFLHAKLLLVDDRFVLLGSANLDYRSLHLNFEANLFIDDREFASRCDRQVTAELASSDEVTLEQIHAASLPSRLADRACYLLQPLL